MPAWIHIYVTWLHRQFDIKSTWLSEQNNLKVSLLLYQSIKGREVLQADREIVIASC